MTFSFKYKPTNFLSGRIYRPLIPLTFNGKESIDLFGLLDSGSDMTVIPLDLWNVLGLEFDEENEVSGIEGPPIKAKQGIVLISFGRGHELYNFKIPVLVPESNQYSKIIIGRQGFFDQFKITFIEKDKRVEFKKEGGLVY